MYVFSVKVLWKAFDLLLHHLPINHEKTCHLYFFQGIKDNWLDQLWKQARHNFSISANL